MSDYNYLFKYIIIGDVNVGKSCLMTQYIDWEFKNFIDPTIGVEFGTIIENINGKVIKIHIWDTAGQENFKSIIGGYFRGAIGGLLVFDLTIRKSFENLSKWLDEVNNKSS